MRARHDLCADLTLLTTNKMSGGQQLFGSNNLVIAGRQQENWAPNRWTYTDLAIAPPRDDEFEALDLYHATAGGEAALARMHRDDAIRKSAHAAIWQAPATSTAS
jgi:hypothetical protein